MKNSPFYLILFCYVAAFGQSSFIQTKSGNKIDFLKNSIQVVVLDKIVAYKTPSGSTKEISFNDIDVAYFGSYKFKSFKFSENKNNYCYFVLAESKDKTMICIGVPDADSEDEAVNARVKYELFVLDSSNKVVDALIFSNQKNEKGAKSRSEVHDFIRRNFEDCLNVMDRFADYDKSSLPQFIGILGFFTQPNFVNCVN